MTETAKEWIQSLFNTKYEKVLQVGEVITDYFGESLVDVQKLSAERIDWSRFMKDAVNSVTTSSDSEFVIVGTTTIPKTKWQEDRNKTVEEALDECYFSALKDFVIYKINRCLEDTTRILIRFPKVTVTNEYNKSVDITELYARMDVSKNGTLERGFSLFRAEYPLVQFLSNYAHSHMMDTRREWQQPCLGRGPIGATQDILRRNFDLDRWGLFCYELAKYVTVESLDGGPYHRLENIGNVFNTLLGISASVTSLSPSHVIARSFVLYYFRTQTLKVAYNDGTYVLGSMPLDFLIDLTNCFVEWYNEKFSAGCYTQSIEVLRSRRILRNYVTNGKQLYSPESLRGLEDINSLQGQELFMFKGQMVKLNITNLSDMGNTPVTLLNLSIASYIVTRALRLINYYYGQESGKDIPNKKCCFL